MNSLVLPLAAICGVAALATSSPNAGTLPPIELAAPAGPSVHCQVPCGIYGDQMRIDMLMEDAATIEKGMTQLVAMDSEEAPSKNQMVRWVMNKDQHSQNIQEMVAAYWLAQRIKTPKDASDEAAMKKYHGQLETMHRITVAAMKCKQTTDVANVNELRRLALKFSSTYFGPEDLKHINEHHGGAK